MTRDWAPASDAPAPLVLPRRRERRRLRFLAPRAAGSGCCLANLAVRTPRWNRSRSERSPQVLGLPPRPGRNGGIFHRGENGGGAEWGGAGAGRATRAGSERAMGDARLARRAPFSSRRTRRRLASLRRLPRRSSASPRPDSPYASSAEAGPARPGGDPGGLGRGGWRTGCHVLLPGALIRGAPGRGLRVGLRRGLPVEVGFRALYPRGRAEAPVEPRLGATCPQIPVSTLPQCPALCPTVPRSRPSPASGDQNLF